MNLGFKAQPAPRPPRVLAAQDQVPCGERYEALGGVRCERPKGRAGGHLSQSGHKYWQAETTSAVAS